MSNLKAAGLPKLSAKMSKTAIKPEKKMTSFNFKKPATTISSPKDINITKFTKVSKVPKSPKVVALKKAIKKVKNVGY